MAEESWDASLQEYMIDPGTCSAAGLAQQSDGAFYAAAPVAEEAGWAIIFKEDHEEDILQEDGETYKKMTINEAKCLLTASTEYKAPEGGMWMGGKKYQITQKDLDMEIGENAYKVKYIFCTRVKGGAHIVITTSQILVGFYDEAAGHVAGNCKKTTLAMAEYLMSIGY